ncbi:hypothetical protein OOZ51_00480 [Arthrobacter sp. MI7-26]|uniref:hypothetical protein n=1 Tax=Arthrobacter sp. MI7-26 TaxID=2993653 RepID=UPI002248DB07|nr:hypothetical protein [Arthrobacter sp. MI7-26]MCX2746288.1 hypothetical protein [Arthrobacter sp. MI7-26]
MIEFTNREIATVVVTIGAIAVLLMIPKIRTDILHAFRGLLKLVFNRQILMIFGIYLAYAVLIIFGASKIRIWNGSLLKDTMIIVVITGLPMLFRANQVKSGPGLVLRTIKETLGISAILVFYLGLYSFPILAEIPLQIFLGILTILAAVAPLQKEQTSRRVGIGANVIILSIVLWLIVQTAVHLAATWKPEKASEIVSSFALSIWLPLLLLPLIYVLAYYMSCEGILVRLSCLNNQVKPPLRVRIAVVLGLHFSTRLASSFVGGRPKDVAQTMTFKGALHAMKVYRSAERERLAVQRAHEQRLQTLAGVSGVDEAGRQLDRREFDATKRGLTRLFYNQMGQHRNRLGHFQTDLAMVYSDYGLDKIASDPAIEMKVRKDKQAWYAWRQTIGGWYFGVGGSSNLEAHWQFDGPQPPTTYPSERNPAWINATQTEPSLEWRMVDGI